MAVDRRLLGIEGEAVAAAWYERRGFAVLARNWRCRSGEIDLVVAAPGLLVVCEVKTRSSNRYGSGAEAVDERKQRRIRAVAVQYLQQSPARGARLRFDVAVVTPGPHGYGVEVVEAAF